jgi:hypothetical protein
MLRLPGGPDGGAADYGAPDPERQQMTGPNELVPSESHVNDR